MSLSLPKDKNHKSRMQDKLGSFDVYFFNNYSRLNTPWLYDMFNILDENIF